MKRIYAEPDDQTLKEIGRAADEKGITRHKLVLEAIDSYLHQSLSDDDSLRKEIDSLRKERDSLRSERDSLKPELDEKWSEIRHLQEEIDSQKKVIDSLTIKLDQATIKNDSLSMEAFQKKMEFDSLQKDLNHALDTIRQKDEMMTFLQGHVAQITQLSLKPSDEEIKKKGWWQFWK
jgi:chromosome segregation ATPase